MKSRKRVKKRPKLPKNIKPSQMVGVKYPQLAGRKSRLNEVMVITKRSNHMPMFTKIDTIHMTHTLVRSFLNQKICGEMTLQETIVQ